MKKKMALWLVSVSILLVLATPVNASGNGGTDQASTVNSDQIIMQTMTHGAGG